MPRLLVLCDIVGRYGGTERYWETVVPQLCAHAEVRLIGRSVEEPDCFGPHALQIAWSDEFGKPNADAARAVAGHIESFKPDAIVTANVFDPLVLQTVRAGTQRWLARIHDYRPFCPNGNKVYPQFPGVCTERMGAACAFNTVVHGCVCGPRAESIRRIRARVAVRNALRGADVVLVSSRYMRATCAQNGIRLDAIALTPPPLPDDAYGSDTPQRPPNSDVLFAGRLSEQKGLLSLIRAFSLIEKHRRPRLVVAGTGAEEESEARRLTERNGVAVSWLGWVSAAELRRHIDSSLAVAVPSLWPEPFGLVGIEAQARGRPAAAYDVGGVGDWIDDAGIAVPRADEQAMGLALHRLTSDGVLWSSYASAARRKAERYRLRRHVETLRAIVEGTAREAAQA